MGGGDKATFYYRNMGHALFKIASEEGPLKLFAGSFTRCLFHVPNVAITMSFVEMIKPKVLNVLETPKPGIEKSD